MNEYSDNEYYEYSEYNDESYDITLELDLEIDNFISFESDNIMNIYYDIKNRIPYFLDKLTFADFLHFIIYLKFSHFKYNILKMYKQKISFYNSFTSKYNSEINNLLYIINLYIQPYRIKIDYSTFVLLALKYTTRTDSTV